MQPAEVHREAGNALFSQEDYEGAIKEYTRAIIQDNSNPAYFTNRALCRLKLKRYGEALEDAQKALELNDRLMKAHFYKGQSLLELDRPNESLRSLTIAYRIALDQKSPSSSSICQNIMQAKKRQWEVREHRRIEKEAAVMHEMTDILRNECRRKLMEAQENYATYEDFADEREAIEFEYQEKINLLEEIFKRADERFRVREVPDYLIDPISFNIFYDPVIGKSGQSFERSVILEHLKTHQFDPFTREHLSVNDLIPNIALRAACEKFLEDNGWAVDY
ncbi:hypothetical protein V1511DRAFT_455618 [Dipodascopsis uninucleata]